MPIKVLLFSLMGLKVLVMQVQVQLETGWKSLFYLAPLVCEANAPSTVFMIAPPLAVVHRPPLAISKRRPPADASRRPTWP